MKFLGVDHPINRLIDWRYEEQQKGNRLKVNRIQKIIDRLNLKINERNKNITRPVRHNNFLNF